MGSKDTTVEKPVSQTSVPAAPLVSVIIATRNRCSLLEQAVASVVAQSFGDWEIVVVDDASEDRTWSWLEGRSDPQLRPIRLEEHAERSAARNVGTRAARGRYV